MNEKNTTLTDERIAELWERLEWQDIPTESLTTMLRYRFARAIEIAVRQGYDDLVARLRHQIDELQGKLADRSDSMPSAPASNAQDADDLERLLIALKQAATEFYNNTIARSDVTIRPQDAETQSLIIRSGQRLAEAIRDVKVALSAKESEHG